MDLRDDLKKLEDEARQLIERVNDAAELEAARVRYLGRKEGVITGLMKRMSTLSAEEKPSFGAAVNTIKNSLTELLDRKAEEVSSRAQANAPREDLTMPGRSPWRGARHPVTLVIDSTDR